MLQAVADLDRINNTILGGGETLLDAIRSARLKFSDEDVQKYRTDVIKLQREYRGVCVRTDVPLSCSAKVRRSVQQVTQAHTERRR